MRDGDIRRIQLLSESVTTKLSAGEVGEGPFSAVKERVENSLDAGATRVEVHAGMSGLKRISVSDNGHGILRDDAALALRDHATSKIGDVHDIEGITTYGFRGEALSSISSISEVTLLTRHASEELGARVQGREGENSFSDYAGPTGTTVIVENLFFNVPARKKFLKSPQTEMRYIRETFISMALANPAVHFSLDSDGKKTLNFPAVKDISERLRQVYGNEVYEGCYFEELSDIKVRISGMLSKPDCLKASRTMQQLFINGRPVEYRYLGYLLSRAYEAVALHGKYPVGILFLEIDPALVDVNIHPAKREVKLFDGRYIDSLILQLANKALNRIHSMNTLPFSSAESVKERQASGSASQFPNGPVFKERQLLPPDEKSVTSGSPQHLFPHGGPASSLRDMGALYNEVAAHRDMNFWRGLPDIYHGPEGRSALYGGLSRGP
jgi:DNA mismatch repair protein MutL